MTPPSLQHPIVGPTTSGQLGLADRRRQWHLRHNWIQELPRTCGLSPGMGKRHLGPALAKGVSPYLIDLDTAFPQRFSCKANKRVTRGWASASVI